MARKNRSGLSPAVINDYISRINPDTGKPYTLTDIARERGVSQQTVSWHKNNYAGVRRSPKEIVRQHWPWDVPADMQRSNPGRLLKLHLEYMQTGGEQMSLKKLAELRGFYKRLIENEVVVEFDPTIAPYEGCYSGGWAYRPRVDSDEKLIIRLNEYARDLAPESKAYWRLPRVLP